MDPDQTAGSTLFEQEASKTFKQKTNSNDILRVNVKQTTHYDFVTLFRSTILHNIYSESFTIKFSLWRTYKMYFCST